MKKILAVLTLFVAATTMTMGQTINRLDTSIFPKPEKGYKQVLIEVPHSDNDHNKKIEFSIGKVIQVDGCNKYMLGGTLEKKDLKGWGYSYYEFSSKGDVASTMMACPDVAKKMEFVSSQVEVVRYNGKLPIVIYVPENFQVRFKIYKTDAEEYFANEVRQKK
ncbi:ecotin family protein [Myroides pelagicus]|uniref:ecotin n=1 Tax=Myroides pelagicus TaxID=270914 RepID=UPI002DBA9439|nr:ecotin family protein [Myroides pelagicus]MEC4114176.1 ecotin family protein [Myroides pelagicus]